MIIYVETNFILELALKQEQHNECNELLKLAQEKKISLVLPAFSFIEPYETLIRRHKTRRELQNRLSTEVRELVRTENYREQKTILEKTSDILIESTVRESSGLKQVINTIVAISTTIDLTKEIINLSIEYEKVNDLSPQDAVIYASIITHLTTKKPEISCFLNRNSKDFDDPDIREALDKLNCKMILSFSRGIEYIKHYLNIPM